MAELLGSPATFATDTVGDEAAAAVGHLVDGGVVLLENLRFNPGETSKDESERVAFARALAAFGDAYVDDASVRCTASTPASTTCRRSCRILRAVWCCVRLSAAAAHR